MPGPNRTDPDRDVHWELCYEGDYAVEGEHDRYAVWAPTTKVHVEGDEIIYESTGNTKLKSGTMQECLNWLQAINDI